MVFNSILVVVSENPVYSVLYLILVFLNSVLILLIYYVDFISLIILIIYIGAVAILFLFVVMMINVQIIQVQESLYRYFPLGFFICICFLGSIFFTLDFHLLNGEKGLIIIKDYEYIVNWFDLLYRIDLITSISECIYAYK